MTKTNWDGSKKIICNYEMINVNLKIKSENYIYIWFLID